MDTGLGNATSSHRARISTHRLSHKKSAAREVCRSDAFEKEDRFRKMNPIRWANVQMESPEIRRGGFVKSELFVHVEHLLSVGVESGCDGA